MGTLQTDSKKKKKKKEKSLNKAMLVKSFALSDLGLRRCWVEKDWRKKESAANAGDAVSIPWSEGSPGEGNGNWLNYFCLESPMDRGAWRATVHGVAKSWTRLSDLKTTSTRWKRMEKSEVSISATTGIRLSETSQMEKSKYHVILYGSWKKEKRIDTEK